ncbi:MAG TPA: cytochrome d ubiquinol oxidase subunit II [Acidimicrobiales bacterium]|nr:cytochrome d ubiquinol oxidase subunit II [Acidimicrobiales bacterium]
MASITMYAVFAGADFGGGFWDLVAGGDRRGWEPRQLIDESITPVWEGNHVWLVFALVIFWTAFPDGFASVMTVLALPLWLALGGIVLRGAGFAFRKEITRPLLVRAAGATFAFSSLMTPFFMGAVVGAIAAGAVPATGDRASLQAWTSWTPILAGFVFVAACAYLAAVYLSGEAARRGDRRLESYFSRRAQAAALVTGALSLGALAELHNADPELEARLTGRALPLVIIAGVCGLAVLGLLAARRVMVARFVAALGVAAVVWGLGVAQYPVLLPGTTVTLDNAGAPEATLTAMIAVAILLVLLVIPSFGLLFTLQSRRMLRGSPLQPEPLAGAGRTTERATENHGTGEG